MKRPNVASIEAFEAKIGFRLPDSYKSFIVVFGAGDFGSSLQIAAPDERAASSVYSLAGANAAYGYHGLEVREFPPSQQKLLSRLYYFGLMNDREWLGWDIEDVRNTESVEYGIYCVGLSTIRFVASSFRELIENTCEKLFSPDPTWDEDELGPKRLYRPASYPPSTQSDV